MIDTLSAASTVSTIIHGAVKAILKQGHRTKLLVFLVGENPASKIYVNAKKKKANELDIALEISHLAEDTTQEQLIALIEAANKNSEINGIIVQLPLPPHLQTNVVINTIDPKKDSDGMTDASLGSLFSGNFNHSSLLPCTPLGCMYLIQMIKNNLSGTKALMIGCSNIVGKPLSIMLLHKKATVTIANSATYNLKQECLNADIICVAAGRSGLITADMVRPGQIIIDIGISKLPETNKVVGDVDFDNCVKVTQFISKVPGGVGPMTVAFLLYNTTLASANQLNLNDKLSLEFMSAGLSG